MRAFRTEIWFHRGCAFGPFQQVPAAMISSKRMNEQQRASKTWLRNAVVTAPSDCSKQDLFAASCTSYGIFHKHMVLLLRSTHDGGSEFTAAAAAVLLLSGRGKAVASGAVAEGCGTAEEVPAMVGHAAFLCPEPPHAKHTTF
jgi:hypothetical protein